MSVERQLMMSSGGVQQYTISNSLRFRASASAYLSRTPASASNRTTWTWSGWFKRGSLGSTQYFLQVGSSATTAFQLLLNSDDTIWCYGGNGGSFLYKTSSVYRDPSAWYHLVVTLNTTSATASSRVLIYLNGVQITAFSTATNPTQNSTYDVNSTNVHYIGSYGGSNSYFDGYLAEINFIDGQALTPSSFGETSSTTGVWIPKKYTGSYGTNGFYLSFNNNTSTTALGYDTSGNGNNWTPNNFSLTTGSTYDSMIDSPTSYASGANNVGNYAVLNPLQTGSYVTGSNANLTITGNTATDSALSLSSIGNLTAGKWYWEYTQGTVGSETCGAMLQAMNGISLLNGESTTNSYGIGVRANGAVYGASKTTATITSWTTGDVIGIAVDIDNGAAYWSKNGTWLNSGVPTSGASKTGAVGAWTPSSSVVVTPSFGAYSPGSVSATFGQRPFAYTPPSGYKALNTYNLSTPSIVDGSKQFGISLYTGTGSSLSVSGANFTPGMVWVKSRSAATDHALYDVIRGTQARLESNTTDAEVTSDNGVTAFNSTGFTVGTLAQVNTSSATYVGWQWKANGAGVTNTDGSITSSVSANQTAGFSVVTWTGTAASAATVGHGLGVAPNLVIIKQRNGVIYGWVTYHSAAGAGSYLVLNQTSAATADSAMFNNTAPTSSVFTLSSGGNIVITNPLAGTMVAYCFAAIPGYSAFGSYTGNGSTDGPFVYCGFRPRYVLLKRSDSTSDWTVFDTSRDPYNMAINYLCPNLSIAETAGSSVQLDIVSNGFKVRGTWQGMNASGGTIIYAAFAESPFKVSLAR